MNVLTLFRNFSSIESIHLVKRQCQTCTVTVKKTFKERNANMKCFAADIRFRFTFTPLFAHTAVSKILVPEKLKLKEIM